MVMVWTNRARSLAGAFLLLAGASGVFTPATMSAAERVRFALEREGGACPPPADGVVWGFTSLKEAPRNGEVSGCVLQLRLPGLTDADLGTATTRLATVSGSPALILEAPDAEIDRTVYAVKLLSSTFRGASNSGL